jgi:L-alanine-DL-glutamate epimerase-like enolase superfamily enzyme
MQISGISIRRHRAPDAGASGYGSSILIVEVSTTDGISGLGFATASDATAPILTAVIRNLILPAIEGRDPGLTTELWSAMYEAAPRRGGEGLMRLAIGAVDFALWDIKGKAAGVPVAKLLGSYREKIPTYCNCAHHLPADKLAERALEDVKNGHRALKIRGTRTFVSTAEATERVRQVREAVGPDIRLMVDVNGTWDVDIAIQMLKAWEPYDLYWLEEPVPPSDIEGYARIRAKAGGTYIAGGEQHVGLAEFQHLIDRQAVDIVQPNAALTGGITDWLRIHGYATAKSVPVSPWNLQSIHLHLAAGLPNVQWIEYFMPDNALLAFQTKLFTGPVLREEVTPEGVFLLAPDQPGIGLSLDPEIEDRSRVPE